MNSLDQKPRARITKWLARILSGVLGLYLLTYVVNSVLGGYWLAPGTDGQHRFAEELGGLSIADAIIWQPRFGHCCLGHLDRAGVFFVPLIQIDQRYVHKTHYITDPNYEAWIRKLPRLKVHPEFRQKFDDFIRTNNAHASDSGIAPQFQIEHHWPAASEAER